MDDFIQRVNQIDWNALQAPSTLDLLAALASEDKALQHSAYESLEAQYVYRGAKIPEDYGVLSEILDTDALVFITPFLIEILEMEKVQKWVVLQLLYGILRNIQINLETLQEPAKTRARMIYQIIRDNSHLYTALLDDENLMTSGLADDLVKSLSSP